MYPDFSYLFHDLFGTEIGNGAAIIKTFGFFLALTFIVAGILVSKELKRKEGEGLIQGIKQKITVGAPPQIAEMIVTGLIGFVLGLKLPYIILHFDEFKADAARVLMSGKGTLTWALLGAVAFVAYRYWDAKEKAVAKAIGTEVTIMPHERTGDLIIAAAISGIAGSKVFAIAEPQYFKQFLQDPLGTFFSGSGMAILGGIIFGAIFVGIYARRKKIPLIHLMDSAAPAILLGYGIGRQGCHFAGDGDWGIANQLAKPFSWLPDWLWAYNYPRNIANDCTSTTFDGTVLNPECSWSVTEYIITPVWPTSVYETLLAFILFLILWKLRKKIKVAGVLFAIYLIMNGIERFLIEFVRINDRYTFLGTEFSQAQFISIGFMVTGIAAIVFLVRQHKKGKPIMF